jgi:UDP-glucose:tetrahydrobiopterin glucosyltransferase
MRILLMSTSVGPFGSGIGGGVELTIHNLAQELVARSHQVQLVAPHGSSSNIAPLTTIPGQVHPFAQNESRSADIRFPARSVLNAMWQFAQTVQHSYDLIVNFAYDWLPFYLTPFFDTPVAHFVSMGSLLDPIDTLIRQCAHRFPHCLGAYTQTQGDTFGLGLPWHILGSGIDMDLYEVHPQPEAALAWVARIAPEKGLEDAVAVAAATGLELRILGKMQDENYWLWVQSQAGAARVTYLGFHPTATMQAHLGRCQALLMTPKWVEAFGNVAIEALACGVPVVSYARGGPIEIIKHGKTGFLVEPDSIEGMVAAVAQLPTLSRTTCRRHAESDYSLPALGDRFERWFELILGQRP